MPRFVLPTGDIIREFESYEELFYFYEDGVRAVVRDMLLLNHGNLLPTLPLYSYDPDTNLWAFRQRLVEEYDRTMDVRATENMLHEYRGLQLEHALGEIDAEVTRMLKGYFRNQIYEIIQDGWKWLGDDLVVRMHFLR